MGGGVVRRDGRENGEMGLWVGEEFHMGMVRGVVGGVLLSRYVKYEGRGERGGGCSIVETSLSLGRSPHPTTPHHVFRFFRRIIHKRMDF